MPENVAFRISWLQALEVNIDIGYIIQNFIEFYQKSSYNYSQLLFLIDTEGVQKKVKFTHIYIYLPKILNKMSKRVLKKKHMDIS